MNQLIILLCVCAVFLVMISIFCGLWDIITGRWRKKQDDDFIEYDDKDRNTFKDF